MIVSATERRIALSGDDAATWLEERGWNFESGIFPKQLYADEVRLGDFVIRRQWTSAASAEWSPLPALVTQITLVIEGDATLTIDTGDRRIHGGSAVHRRLGRRAGFESSTPVALMQIETLNIPHDFFPSEKDDESVFETEQVWREMLSGLISATLNSDVEPSMSEFAYVKMSIEYAAMALLLGSLKKDSARRTEERPLHQRAVDLIVTRASDSRLTLDDLASELSVSKSHLQRIFRVSGTTPLRFLEQQRLTLARDILAGQLPDSVDELDSVARRAGFASARVMRDAFRRDATRPAHRADDRPRRDE